MRRTMAHQLLTHFRPVRSRHPDPSKEGLVVPPRSIATRSAGGHGLPEWRAKLEVRGKFFFTGTQKILLKGVTYGPFAPDAFGSSSTTREPLPRIWTSWLSSARTPCGLSRFPRAGYWT